MTYSNRLDDLKRFYAILSQLESQIGMKTLGETLRKRDFPSHWRVPVPRTK